MASSLPDNANTDLAPENGNSSLCATCSNVNFELLFKSHTCSSIPHLTSDIFHYATCCEVEIQSLTEVPKIPARSYELTGLIGMLKSCPSACPFCYFLFQCQVRLGLVQTESKHSYCILKPRPSLDKIAIPEPDYNSGTASLTVQDSVALQIWKVSGDYRGDYISRPTPHPILRVVDGGDKSLTRNKRAGSGVLARKLDPDRIDYNLIGEWLTICRSTHSNCEEVDTKRIPGLQVIDCTTGYIIPFPSKDYAANHEENYVTLSYLWGSDGVANESVVKHTGESDVALPAQIPLVISDAIQVVKQLGYRYLWVDRCCIPQEDAAAKHVQILNMGRIYSNSILTIIAAAGEGPEYGLPGVSSRTRTPQLGVKITSDISLVLYEAPKDAIVQSKWNKRGWTYQEGLLSKRRLVFTDTMVYFQCQEMHGDEVLSLPVHKPGEDRDDVHPLSLEDFDLEKVFPQPADWKNPLSIWKRIAEYGPRELGYDSDALNAISGVMDRYALAAKESGFKSFCGLPILPISSWEKNCMWLNSARGHRPRELSLSTWFQDHEKRKGASEAWEIDDNNLTCSLVYSLAWRHDWSSLNGLVPTTLEQARRKVFGSWTTAGWRTRKCIPSGMSLFDSCLRIHVQYSEGALLDWEDDNAMILEMSRNGRMPLSLNITGLVMDVPIELIRKRRQTYGAEDKIIPTWPFMDYSDYFLVQLLERLVDGDYMYGEGSNRGILFLIFGCDPYWDYSWTFLEFSGIILRPVTMVFDGESHTFYEKLDAHTFRSENGQWPQIATLTREMEVRLM